MFNAATNSPSPLCINSPQGFLLKYEQHFMIGWQVTRIRESLIREAT